MQTTLAMKTLGWIMSILIGSGAWTLVRETVATLMGNTTMSGAEKRDFVIEAAKSAGVTVAGYLLNLAIEAAVTRFKLQAPTT